jgi:N-acetylmuramoyl-L-alanine amidase
VILPATADDSASLIQRLLKRNLSTLRAKRRFVRYSLITANLLLLGGVAMVVVSASRTTTASDGVAATYAAAKNQSVVGPLDQLTSVDIAVNVARVVALPEAVAVTNQSDSAKILNAIAPADTSVVAKPQIVATNLKSVKDIQIYTVQSGDSVSSIAAAFGITSDSVRWSNDISGNDVQAGKKLYIPPVDGIVYTVRVGDTPASIAEKYSANQAQIIAFNDAELSGIKPTQRIVIPDGQKPAPAAPVYNFYASFSPTYGYNGYDPGWCTWYVASKISVPTGWGNANTWDDRARVTPGWKVTQTPRVGAIAQTNAGWAGHVGIVEEVSADGRMIKYSDMNGLAGFNRVGYSDWVPTLGKYQNFIYR